MLSGECYEFSEDKLLQQLMRYVKEHNGDGKFQECLRALEARVDKYAKQGKISGYEYDRSNHLLKAFKRVKI